MTREKKLKQENDEQQNKGLNSATLIAIGRRTARIAIMFALLAGLGLLVHHLYGEFDHTWIDTKVRTRGLVGIEYFFIVGALLTACGLPRQLIAFLGGYAFGFLIGTLVSLLATVLGCVISLSFARVFTRPYLRKRLPKKIEAIDHFLKHDPTVKTVIIRFLPVGNNLLTNLIAGASNVRVGQFALGSLIGYLPQTVIFALMGKGVVVVNIWKIALSLILFVVSSALSYFLYQRYRNSELLADTSYQDLELNSHT